MELEPQLKPHKEDQPVSKVDEMSVIPPQPRNLPQKAVPLSPQLHMPQHNPPVPTASPASMMSTPRIPTAPTPLVDDSQPRNSTLPLSQNEEMEQRLPPPSSTHFDWAEDMAAMPTEPLRTQDLSGLKTGCKQLFGAL